MRSVSLTVSEPLAEEYMRKVAFTLEVSLAVDQQTTTFYLGKWGEPKCALIYPVNIDLLYDVQNGYHASLLNELHDDMHCYLVEYKWKQGLRELLIELSSICKLVIDDEHGLIVRGSDFSNLCKSNADNDTWWLGGEHQIVSPSNI